MLLHLTPCTLPVVHSPPHLWSSRQHPTRCRCSELVWPWGMKGFKARHNVSGADVQLVYGKQCGMDWELQFLHGQDRVMRLQRYSLPPVI